MLMQIEAPPALRALPSTVRGDAHHRALVVLLVMVAGIAIGAVFYRGQLVESELRRELAEVSLEVAKAQAAIGIAVEYEATLEALIAKLREYSRFDAYTPEQITGMTRVILEQAALHESSGITPTLILAIMEQESGFDPAAVSSVRAVGVMQVRRVAAQATLERLGYTWSVDLLKDPLLCIRTGTEYLAWLHRIFVSEGVEAIDDWTYTLTAYNWGSDAALRLMLGERGDILLPDLKYAAGVQKKINDFEAMGVN